MEVKDYTLAEELVGKMKEQASDFDHSKPTAAIEGARVLMKQGALPVGSVQIDVFSQAIVG